MKFKPGQSGNPTGRPKGSKNGATTMRVQRAQLLDKKGAELLEHAFEMALEEPSVMTALIDRLLPKLKPVDRPIDAPIQSGQSIEKNRELVLTAIAEQRITADEGRTLLQVLDLAAPESGNGHGGLHITIHTGERPPRIQGEGNATYL